MDSNGPIGLTNYIRATQGVMPLRELRSRQALNGGSAELGAPTLSWDPRSGRWLQTQDAIPVHADPLLQTYVEEADPAAVSPPNTRAGNLRKWTTLKPEVQLMLLHKLSSQLLGNGRPALNSGRGLGSPDLPELLPALGLALGVLEKPEAAASESSEITPVSLSGDLDDPAMLPVFDASTPALPWDTSKQPVFAQAGQGGTFSA